MSDSATGRLSSPTWKAGALTMVSALFCAGLASAQSAASTPELEVTISCPDIEYKLGDEIPITFTITNIVDSPYKFSTRNYDRGGRMHEYQLTASKADGDPLTDPRESWAGGPGGGLGGAKDLAKGESGAMTIALNRWCVIKEAGRLTVQGTYTVSSRNRKEFVSPTIHITVLPRSPQEMTEHIRQLHSELRQMGPSVPQIPLTAAPPPGHGPGSGARDSREKRAERNHLIQRLMYTHDSTIAPILIDSWYDAEDTSFWIVEAFSYYLPHNPEMYALIHDAALNRGLKKSMLQALQKVGSPDQSHVDIIARALASDDPRDALEATGGAQLYWSDEFLPALRKIATDETFHNVARMRAIYAIERNAPNAREEILKSLLEDQDVEIQALARALLKNR